MLKLVYNNNICRVFQLNFYFKKDILSKRKKQMRDYLNNIINEVDIINFILEDSEYVFFIIVFEIFIYFNFVFVYD